MTAPVLPASGILDANGIIGLAKSGCFALLPRLFDGIWVPPPHEGLIPAAKPHLDQRIRLGFGIPGADYQALLAALGQSSG